MAKYNKDLDSIFKVIFNVKKINKNLSYNNLKRWDSLNHVKLIMAIESKFKIRITPDDSLELLSYKKIINYLQKTKK
jgi:acyl carrier protein